MIGSWKLSAKGCTRTSTARLCWDIAATTILGLDMIDMLPVALHRHRSPFFSLLGSLPLDHGAQMDTTPFHTSDPATVSDVVMVWVSGAP